MSRTFMGIGCLLLWSMCKPPIGGGKKLYKMHCQNCHGESGRGLAMLYPPLKNSDYLMEHYDELACIIVYGLHDSISVNGRWFDVPMAGISHLSDVEVANIINYLGEQMLSSNLKFVSPDQVKSRLMNCN